MKVKVELTNGETIEQADELLEKALKAKAEPSENERYADQHLNDFHDYINERHQRLVTSVLKEIEDEIKLHVNR
jgi:hypothetical protein